MPAAAKASPTPTVCSTRPPTAGRTTGKTRRPVGPRDQPMGKAQTRCSPHHIGTLPEDLDSAYSVAVCIQCRRRELFGARLGGKLEAEVPPEWGRSAALRAADHDEARRV